MSDPVDRRVAQCNYAEGTSIARPGARAYVARGLAGNGYERIPILVRSRGGRWVRKWERSDRLIDFRVKTLPPEHPMYPRIELLDGRWAEEFCAVMQPRGAPDE